MNLIINGESKDVENAATLEDLVNLLGLPSERIAVELNLQVVRRIDWSKINLSEGDKLEIIHFVGGG